MLAGADAVVNCAGTLQDAPGESTQNVQAGVVAAMAEPCERAGIRRVVHVSEPAASGKARLSHEPSWRESAR